MDLAVHLYVQHVPMERTVSFLKGRSAKRGGRQAYKQLPLEGAIPEMTIVSIDPTTKHSGVQVHQTSAALRCR